MEVQIQELIESIKKDGVGAAEEQAAEIIEEAEGKRKKIISDAEKEAQRIVKEGEAKVEKREQSAQAALEQAGRDLLLSVERRLIHIAESILAEEIRGALSGETLEKVLLEIAGSDTAGSETDIEISEPLYQSLSQELLAQLKKKLASGSEIRPVKHIDSGFRISEKEGSGYVSFTAEDLASMLSAFLSPELQKMIRTAAKDT